MIYLGSFTNAMPIMVVLIITGVRVTLNQPYFAAAYKKSQLTLTFDYIIMFKLTSSVTFL